MKYSLPILLILSTTLFSATNIGVIKQTTGIVKIKRLKKIITVVAEDKVYKNDIIITKNNSSICIILNNGKVITLGENSILPINKHLTHKKDSKNYFTLNI
jgi:DNA gyrase/topoisomerase IV subunit A